MPIKRNTWKYSDGKFIKFWLDRWLKDLFWKEVSIYLCRVLRVRKCYVEWTFPIQLSLCQSYFLFKAQSYYDSSIHTFCLSRDAFCNSYCQNSIFFFILFDGKILLFIVGINFIRNILALSEILVFKLWEFGPYKIFIFLLPWWSLPIYTIFSRTDDILPKR